MVDLVLTTALCSVCANVAVLCVHIHACLLAVYIWGERECHVLILRLKYFVFRCVKEEINVGTYIYSCEQEWDRENVVYS